MDSISKSAIERYLQIKKPTDKDWKALSKKAQEQLLKGEELGALPLTLEEKDRLIQWEIYEPRRRFHRLILEKAVDEVSFLLHHDTDYDHMEDVGEAIMVGSKNPSASLPTDDELRLKVGDYLLAHLRDAIVEYEAKNYERRPRYIEDMANLFFDCRLVKLLGKKSSDFSRIPLFQKARTQPIHVNPRWGEIVEDVFTHSLMKDMRKIIPKITEIASSDPFHPLVHVFEDWAHRRLLSHGEPEVKRWLKDIYRAKFDLLITRIEYGSADEPGTKASIRVQNMLKQQGETGKKDYRYLTKVQEVLRVKINF